MNRTISLASAGRAACAAFLGLATLSCNNGGRLVAQQGDSSTGGHPPPPLDAGALPPGSFCSLPGSVVWTEGGARVVGTAGAPDIGWLTLPVGFCAHYFATVRAARQLRFTARGDLFVASPTSTTTGGATDGVAGVVLLQDVDRDGKADANVTFLQGLPSVQGLMVSGGYLYYQDHATIRRVPIEDGATAPAGPSEVVTEMDGVWKQDSLHWPKVLDVARDGTVYVTNGSTQSESCTSQAPVFGGIFKLNADATTTEVARGFRNPIALRCEPDHDVCLAIELALDYSDGQGGREKILPVREGDDWGYPCCATTGLPYAGITYSDTKKTPDCSGVAAESASFIIGHTPFGIDFETGRWPEPWGSRAFVTLHGDYASWNGARVVAIALDPATGLPLPASELPSAGTPAENLLEFASGWDDGMMDHGRPAPVAFAPDGRLFLGDDQRGAVIWIAPVDLTMP